MTKGDIAASMVGQSRMELRLDHLIADLAELKARQIEIRDLLARVAVCVDHTAPDQT
ncbi:hypothetical protein [Sphaerimonospora thailandensis]|uniref:Uncharacterized protein n=1 Tax=Sphaerimonospora thailandensis TaxID=795644 RepID=A0A8J3RBI3_9ACTN|nr:hypothetical protein [Sphaerimonospora thailandensis]GIH69493.1 hypothetical protein Mth01_17460 [Sphaerimonospora thailandensis]